MNRKLEMQSFDIPRDDIECWDRYPKYHWVYDLSRLLDIQNIKWSPFKTENLEGRVLNMSFETINSIKCESAFIYINIPTGTNIISEVYITKGEIKLIRYIDKLSLCEIIEHIGNIELRINAFSKIYRSYNSRIDRKRHNVNTSTCMYRNMSCI